MFHATLAATIARIASRAPLVERGGTRGENQPLRASASAAYVKLSAKNSAAGR